MKRILAMILALLLVPTALAEATPEPTRDPALVETIHSVVNALFAAATGTTAELETEARKDLTDEEILARNAANLEYRQKTLPWLIEALRIEDETMAEPTPSPSPSPTPEASPEPVWTIEDSFIAFQQNSIGTEYLNLLTTLGATDLQTSMRITKEYYSMWLEEIDHEWLRTINPDYACWIFAPGTQIDYPVVHGTDNSKYLNRMFNGAKNSAGTLFIDYRNLPEYQDPNTLIYGHHMRNDSMFGSLTDYATQAYFDAHPYILLIGENEIVLGEIFAGYTTSDKDHCYDIAISDTDDMRAFLAEAIQKSDFVSGVEPKTTDRLVTLSTCAYAFENARYIAISRLLPVWQRPLSAQ